MADSLSIGWSQAQAAGAVRTFRRLYAVNLALQSIVGLLTLFTPVFASSITGVTGPEAHTFMALWGAMVLVASALQLPGYLNPLLNRWLIGIAILARFFMVIVFLALGGDFFRLALFDLIFGVALAVTFHRALIAELQTRP